MGTCSYLPGIIYWDEAAYSSLYGLRKFGRLSFLPD